MAGKFIAMVLAAGALGACHTASAQTTEGAQEPAPPAPVTVVGDAVQQPFRDLNLIRDEIPPLIAAAAEAPYEHADILTCDTVNARIAELDQILGPDLDQLAEDNESQAASIATDALRGVVSLPFSGIIRRISGARDRDRIRQHAFLSAMVRRGFLKGMAASSKCPPLPAPPQG